VRRIAALVTAVLLVVAAPAAARTLHGPGGFTVKAPSGYALKSARGVYRISGHGGTLRFARVAAAGRTPAAAGAELARALKTTPKGVRTSAARYRATVGRRAIDVRKAAGKTLAVRTFSGGDRARLRRIGDTIRGGKRAALPASIPMKRFTAPHGGSTALVPDLEGWVFDGGSGVVEGIGPQGSFVFGYPFAMALPGTLAAGGFPAAPFPANVGDGLGRVVPIELRRLRLDVSAISGIAPFPGAELISAAPFTSTFASGRYAQRAGPGGEGVFFYGFAPPDETGAYLNYLSYAIVKKGTDPRVGAALIRAWGSWNPAGDQSRRISATINTILTTQVAGGGIDPKVFDEAARKWDAYIRY
jgi:hypothetical protein